MLRQQRVSLFQLVCHQDKFNSVGKYIRVRFGAFGGLVPVKTIHYVVR